ncbi:MAG: phospho-N-acetylmuramoyl-pentapeptide-transferase [Armatimonadota bacterium]
MMALDITSLIAFFIAFVGAMIIMPFTISTLKAMKAGQVIQQEGPQAHAAKAGTPTMGGIGILFGLLLGAGWFVCKEVASTAVQPQSPSMTIVFAVLILTLAYAVLGAADDYLTIRPRGGVRGIGSKPKFALQFLIAIAFVAWLNYSGNMSTVIKLGSLFSFDLGWAYAPLAVLFITGMANFVNITDGLDGLAAGLTIPLALSLALIPALMGISGSSPYSCLLFAIAGACLAFLWYNYNPAKVFMGDTGSLAIGVMIPALAIVMKLEVFMIIAGMVFILDGLSSALQWAYFKYTRIRTGTGKRIFKMSPVHHHFELSGLPEQLVVVRFWIVGALFALLALLIAGLQL